MNPDIWDVLGSTKSIKYLLLRKSIKHKELSRSSNEWIQTYGMFWGAQRGVWSLPDAAYRKAKHKHPRGINPIRPDTNWLWELLQELPDFRQDLALKIWRNRIWRNRKDTNCWRLIAFRTIPRKLSSHGDKMGESWLQRVVWIFPLPTQLTCPRQHQSSLSLELLIRAKEDCWMEEYAQMLPSLEIKM